MPQINGRSHNSKETRKGSFGEKHPEACVCAFCARTETCPDCLANDQPVKTVHGKAGLKPILDPMGLPRRRHRAPLKKSSGYVPPSRTTSYGCETCGGTGRVPATLKRVGRNTNDPMENPVRG